MSRLRKRYARWLADFGYFLRTGQTRAEAQATQEAKARLAILDEWRAGRIDDREALARVQRVRPCRYCPDPRCPEDCPECGAPIHDLDAVSPDRVLHFEAEEVPLADAYRELAGQVGRALEVIREWQRDGEPNEYLTRVHRALQPPASGTATPDATREEPAWLDAGPPHRGPLCFGPTGDWLCRQRADNGHSDHAPYVEGEYRRADPGEGSPGDIGLGPLPSFACGDSPDLEISDPHEVGQAHGCPEGCAVHNPGGPDVPREVPPELYEHACEAATIREGHADGCIWFGSGNSECSCHVWPAACAGVDTAWDALRGDPHSDPVNVPLDALRGLVEVAMWVSRGRSMAMTPSHVKQIGKAYPDAKARRALGALADAGLLDQFRESGDG